MIIMYTLHTAYMLSWLHIFSQRTRDAQRPTDLSVRPSTLRRAFLPIGIDHDKGHCAREECFEILYYISLLAAAFVSSCVSREFWNVMAKAWIELPISL